MTTILGLTANSGIEGVVIAADRQLNWYDDPPHETKFLKKEQTKKINYGKNWIIGDVGGISNQFAVLLKSGKNKLNTMIYNAVRRFYEHPKSKKPHFPEINEINTLLRRRDVEEDCLHAMILAAKVDGKTGLWQVDEFGNLKESKKEYYITLGSGGEYVTKYLTELSEKGDVDQDVLTIPAAIDLAVSCLDVAQQDPNTGGLDLAVLTSKGVKYYGNFIQETMQRQKKSMIKSIKNNYK